MLPSHCCLPALTTQVSLSPLRPLEGPLTQPLLTQPADSLQQVLAAWPAGGATQPLPAAPQAATLLDSSLEQLQQSPEQQQQQGELRAEESSAAAPMLQESLDSSLAQLQEHLQQLQRHADTLQQASSAGQQQQQQHAGASLLPDDYADLLHDLPLAEDSSAATVEQLSDAAFMALAAHSTAAAEEAAAAVEAVTSAGQPMAQPDALLDTLRANLQVFVCPGFVETWLGLINLLFSGTFEILLMHISFCLPVAGPVSLRCCLIWLRSWTSSLQRWQCASVAPLLESTHPKVCELFHARAASCGRRLEEAVAAK